MTYAIGSTITAADINSQIDDVNSIFGTGSGDKGYGASDQSNVSIGGTIDSVTFTSIRNRISNCADHQGTIVDLPSANDLEVGDIALAYTGGARDDIPTAIADIITNRATVAVGQFVIGNNVNNSARSTSWTSFIKHRWKATWTDQDEARAFFNKGGQIRFSGDRTGGSSTPQNTDWTNLLAGAGTKIFDGTDYFNSLTTVQQFSTVTGTGAYSANDWTIKWWTNTVTDPNGRGGKGNILTFECQFKDDYTGAGDSVDGTITNRVGYRRSSTIFGGSLPTFSDSVLLTAGT